MCDGDRLVGTVQETMTADLVYCFENQTLDEAAELMPRREVRRLPILDRGHRLVGIVALADLARPAPEPATEALEGVSQPPEETPGPRSGG